jgi:hypothetical protein
VKKLICTQDVYLNLGCFERRHKRAALAVCLLADSARLLSFVFHVSNTRPFVGIHWLTGTSRLTGTETVRETADLARANAHQEDELQGRASERAPAGEDEGVGIVRVELRTAAIQPQVSKPDACPPRLGFSPYL